MKHNKSFCVERFKSVQPNKVDWWRTTACKRGEWPSEKEGNTSFNKQTNFGQSAVDKLENKEKMKRSFCKQETNLQNDVKQRGIIFERYKNENFRPLMIHTDFQVMIIFNIN